MIDTKTFILAGDATFTVTSLQSGTRYTYKVSLSEDKRRYFVSVLTGPDNWSNYKYFGCINPNTGAFSWAKPESAKVAPDAPSAKGFEWFWRHLNAPVSKIAAVKVSHEGKCCRCGRKLTVPESIESGIGPECAAQMGM
jgi:hypothetical protein